MARVAVALFLLGGLDKAVAAAPALEVSAKTIEYIRPGPASTAKVETSAPAGMPPKATPPASASGDAKKIAYYRNAKPAKHDNSTLTIDVPNDDCTCRSQCTCADVDDFIQCLTHPSSFWCEPMDPTEACNSAESQCTGDLDITCTPTSSGCQFTCNNPSPAPGFGGSGCDPDKTKLFNMVCVLTPLAIPIYIVCVIGVLGLLYMGVKACCSSKRD